jgi:hypothetical protein
MWLLTCHKERAEHKEGDAGNARHFYGVVMNLAMSTSANRDSAVIRESPLIELLAFGGRRHPGAGLMV